MGIFVFPMLTLRVCITPNLRRGIRWNNEDLNKHDDTCRTPAGLDIFHNTAHTLLTVITAACEISKQACKTKTKGGVYAEV